MFYFYCERLKIRARWFHTFPTPTNSRNRVTLIKVVIMRNVGTRCNHDCTFIHERVHHRSLDSVYVRIRTRRRDDGHLVYMEISNWHAPVSRWYTIRLGEKTPFTETYPWVMDGEGRVERARTKVHRASRFSVTEIFEKEITIRKFTGNRTKLHPTWIRHLVLVYLRKPSKIDWICNRVRVAALIPPKIGSREL